MSVHVLVTDRHHLPDTLVITRHRDKSINQILLIHLYGRQDNEKHTEKTVECWQDLLVHHLLVGRDLLCIE